MSARPTEQVEAWWNLMDQSCLGKRARKGDVVKLIIVLCTMTYVLHSITSDHVLYWDL